MHEKKSSKGRNKSIDSKWYKMQKVDNLRNKSNKTKDTMNKNHGKDIHLSTNDLLFVSVIHTSDIINVQFL